jgi:hypothetical protein
MTKAPCFYKTKTDDGDKFPSEYEHWYMRRDQNGCKRRDPKDTPGTLFPQLFKDISDVKSGFAGMTVADFKSVDNLPFPPHFKEPIKQDMPDGVELIVAVIDTDIPLGHRAFRDEEGKSRVLYHWNIGHGPIGSENTLMGQEFTKDDIDKLLKDHSHGDHKGELDQDAFNREIGSVDVHRPSGSRALQTRYSHGAHMLDVAAGADIGTPDGKEFAKKVGIITVSMPSRWEFGEAGEFIDMFMLFAVARVYFIVKGLGDNQQKPTAYACVTSLAFGRQAGVKRDDLGMLAQLLNGINESRPNKNTRFDLILPAGNDNLDRVVARYELKPGDHHIFDWNILPSDQSDNYLEVWAEKGPGVSDEAVNLAVDLFPAGEDPQNTGHMPDTGRYWDVADENGKFGARVYRIKPIDLATRAQTGSGKYIGYLFATSSTDPRGDSLATIPAGRWKVVIKNEGEVPLQVNCSVQTDQSILPVAGVSGRSYLDDEDYKYRVRDEDGQLLDSVKFEDDEWKATDNASGVRRRGTINAASSQTFSAVVGGYRQSDGQPASYSATGASVPDNGSSKSGRSSGRDSPDALMPTDDSPVLAGTFAAGSTDGSRVAMRGTSFAASKATRLIAETWLYDTATRKTSASKIIQQIAAAHEISEIKAHDHGKGKQKFKHPYDPVTSKCAKAKFGRGRVRFHNSSMRSGVE